jgi:hypothetical protein
MLHYSSVFSYLATCYTTQLFLTHYMGTMLYHTCVTQLSCTTPVTLLSCTTPVTLLSCTTPVTLLSCTTPVPLLSCTTPVTLLSCTTPVTLPYPSVYPLFLTVPHGIIIFLFPDCTQYVQGTYVQYSTLSVLYLGKWVSYSWFINSTYSYILSCIPTLLQYVFSHIPMYSLIHWLHNLGRLCKCCN